MKGIHLCHILAYVSAALGSTVLISDSSMSRMIELTTQQPYCHVHTDRGTIRTMLLASDAARVRQMSDDAIEKLEEVCADKVKLIQQQGGFIYPGTKWCGPGDRAANYSDLGYHKKEDMCCRDHDNCPKYLMKGECREGICNNSPYTRSHCDCDASFRKCLQTVNSETANTIGAIFFNIIQVICFKERSPCSEWQNSTDPVDYEIRENLKSFFNQESENCSLEWAKSDRYKPSALTSQFTFSPIKKIKMNFLKQLLAKFGVFVEYT
ncbi:phospholipase A2-like isoform X2 [Anthonomus grandis grandis]|nr:phospholipase A2-like isoform X2 [Anthonomus grandis grandis]XP_050292826.1 phospholipase A2-like isoform X2 [Anthonomus grandis grandis]